MCKLVHTHVKARGWHLRSSSVTFCFILLRQDLSLKLELTVGDTFWLEGLSEPAVCCFSVLGLQMRAAVSSLLHGCLGCFRFSARASTSPSELSSEPLCPSCRERLKQQREREAAHLPPRLAGAGRAAGSEVASADTEMGEENATPANLLATDLYRIFNYIVF